jgi:dTDP-4-dehydrorhamnose 3,5-epimerase
VKFEPTSVAGAWLVKPEPHEDPRGSFARIFCSREFEGAGLQFVVAQSNLARSRHAGQVRGLHYVPSPEVEQKLVRCVAGAVLDVIVDMRRDSPTWLACFSTRLDPVNNHALFIPSGVAHGYQVLEDDTDFMYLTDGFYRAGLEKGVRYDDPRLAIPWPLPPRGVTERDATWPLIAAT